MRRLRVMSPGWLIIGTTTLLLLGGCEPGAVRQTSLSEYYDDMTSGGNTTKMFGDQGLSLSVFGDKADPGKDSGGALGVNAYLWRGALDTLSFMPLASADPFGGVIITDWYNPPESPSERFKLNVFILGRELRADGVRAAVFRQKRDASGQWADAPVDSKTGTDVENAILARARQIRLSTASK